MNGAHQTLSLVDKVQMYQLSNRAKSFVSNFQFLKEKVKIQPLVIFHSAYASSLAPVLNFGIQEIPPAMVETKINCRFSSGISCNKIL